MKLALLALVLAAVAVPGVEDGVRWYMRGTGTPIAGLSREAPADTTLGDPDTDGWPGRTLRPGEYQEFLTTHEGVMISGSPIVTLWTAGSGFAGATSGELRVDLLECRGADCRHLAGTSMRAARWAPADTWVERTFVLPELDVMLDPGGQICLRVDAGDGSVMIAYDSEETPSSLWLPNGPPQPEEPDDVEGSLPRPIDPRNPGPPDSRSDLVAGMPPMVGDESRNERSLAVPFLAGLASVGALCACAGVAFGLRRPA